MKDRSTVPIAFIREVLAVAICSAISAQDKYAVNVPNGLAFSEFRGYEAWQVVSVSQDEKFNLIDAIVANPVMIKAYLTGVPGNAGLSAKAPKWRRSIGTRKRRRCSPPRRCQAPSMTSTSW